jgi:hypothetical protein
MATKQQIDKALESYPAATARSRERRSRGELAVSAHYEPERRRVHVELVSGTALAVPVKLIQGLERARPAQLANVHVVGRGYGLHWPDLDVDLAVPDLIAGSLGTRAWMRALAKRGGERTSPAKTAASRENGKRGGRPRKEPPSTPA